MIAARETSQQWAARITDSLPRSWKKTILADWTQKAGAATGAFIAQGGAATIAWARFQFEETATLERDKVADALRRYCELDTLAMVMIFEAWREWVR